MQATAGRSAEEGGWRAPAGRSVVASAVKSLALVAAAVIGLVRLFTGAGWPTWGLVTACAAAAVLIVGGVAAYDVARLRSTRWRLTGERLELRSGITVRRARAVPRDRVRSVDLRADPVLRLLGLTVVKVGTGERAADGDELTLDPLTRHDAETLRRTLLRGAAADEQSGERVDRDAPLAELRWSWVRYAPLTVWTFAGAAVVLGVAYKAAERLGLEDLAEQAAGPVWDWVTGHPLPAVVLLLTVNVAVGALGAVAQFAESWGRYRLDREPGRLRLRRGLLTARSLTLEERRLRGVEVREPLLLRLGGGARVKAIATGLGKAGDGETEDVGALAPPLPRPLAWRLADAIATGDARTDLGAGLVRHPPAARRRRVVRAVVLVAVLTAMTGVVSWSVPWPWPWMGPWMGAWVWAVPAVAAPVAWWGAVTGARSLGHALAGRHLVTRQGAMIRRTVALERAGISGWTITESFFQRRAGLVTVSATTAAGDGHYEVLDVGRGDGLELAARAAPGLLEPFLVRPANGPDVSLH
ncbi:PH domain-containing protein [Nonomuraea wenchangensis]|uniref:PH domain-containing protein n=1 Tax=Nonomuraea wenchangensis TaxID=568860 RepID=UPI0015A516D0|nr:PH domain-containing protein [Nonomuraea wenchangensis]